MKALLITLLVTSSSFSSIAFGSAKDDCYRSFRRGQDAISTGVSHSNAAEAARQRMLETEENESTEDFCNAADEADRQAHLAINAFIKAREEFGNAYSVCSSPNDESAGNNSEKAGKQVEKLLEFTGSVSEYIADVCED